MGPLGELWRLGSREGMWQSPKRQMSDSLGLRPSLSSLLRRSLLPHRGPVLAWKRRRRLDNTLLLQ